MQSLMMMLVHCSVELQQSGEHLDVFIWHKESEASTCVLEVLNLGTCLLYSASTTATCYDKVTAAECDAQQDGLQSDCCMLQGVLLVRSFCLIFTSTRRFEHCNQIFLQEAC